MNRILKYPAALAGAILMGACGFWLGKRQAAKDSFGKGVTVGQQQSALIRGALDHHHVAILDSGKSDRLRWSLEDGMWRSVVPLDQLLHNLDASEEDRKRAGRVLPRLIGYFHLNPRAITGSPEKSGLSDSTEKGFQEKVEATHDPTEKQTLNAVHDASKGVMKETERMFDSILEESRKFDLETQAVIDRHVSKRNFPGTKRETAGITWLLPEDSGGGGGSSDRFHFKGKKIRVLYESGVLRVDDQDFGNVSKGDTVDLRMLGRVFVNDTERFPAEP